MNTPPRNLPRFLPTLTEVVHPADLAAEKHSIASMLEAPLPATQQMEGALDHALTTEVNAPEVNALVSSLVAEQMQVLRFNLRQELEVMVKHAVQEAMNSKPIPH